MLKKTFMILPVLAVTMVMGNTAYAGNQCSPRDMKGMEGELKHISLVAKSIEKNKNVKERDRDMADLKKKSYYLEKQLEACKKDRERVCREELPKAEKKLKRIGERWIQSFMNPHDGNRKNELRQVEADGERVSRFIRMCKI